jgi:hypothetical protein
VTGEIRNAAAQRDFGIRCGNRVGNNPQTEFVAVQSCPKIVDRGIEQVLLALVENTGMHSPGHVAKNANASIAQSRTRDGLPVGPLMGSNIAAPPQPERIAGISEMGSSSSV